jgi:DNA (cytosine-5)-methyltransferase 1
MHTVADICCGMGGIGEAFAQEGIRPSWACDLDPVARAVYEANHRVRPLGDLWDVDPAKVPDTDIFVIGMPCQPFSAMGRHGCWDDTRS